MLRASPVQPPRAPTFVKLHPELWRRTGPAPDRPGVWYRDPTGNTAVGRLTRRRRRRR